jgi:acetolactate synthase-1/2/3 large subunit
LADAGIKRVFGLPGGEVVVLMEELRQVGVDFVLMRHEANAGIAAAVYGKLHRQPGVVLVTLGPGAANLMLPISSSYLDQEPLLAISAQIPDDFPIDYTHQRLPLHEVYGPVTKYVAKVTADNVADVVPRALAACMDRPFGAAYLTLSAREAIKPVEERSQTQTDSAHRNPPVIREDSTAVSARELTDALRAAERPLVIVGLGTDPDNSGALRRWLDNWGLPVVVTPKVKGIVDETGSNFVGTIGGMAADGLILEALGSADLVIGFGFDPVEHDGTWFADAEILWVLEAPNVGGLVPDGTELVDHADLLGVLAEQEPPSRWEAPFRDVQERRLALLDDRPEVGDTMWQGDLIKALASAAPSGTIVATDVGAHKYLFGQFWPSRSPETFWMSNGLSGMSYGLAAAVGAKLARPGAPVLAAVGDGGFSMNCQELETAERVGAPFVTVVLEDAGYGLIKIAQDRRDLDHYRTDFQPIDSVKIAEACGVAGLRTADPDEMASAVGTALSRNESLVVEVPIDYAHYKRLL